MLEAVAELGTASSLLSEALDRYLNACTAIQAYYVHSSPLDVPPALASCVANESDCAPSYANKLKKAHAIINKAQNISTCHSSIFLFPSEILARIFHLVVGVTCGIGADSPKSRSIPRYPDYLTHVCSRWRREAIKMPTLWTHIDLVYFHSSDHKFVDRAEVFAERAKELALNVHIYSPKARDEGCRPSAVYEFLFTEATRIRSFELEVPNTVSDFESMYFEHFCRLLDPEVLEEFGVTDRGTYVPNYLYAAEPSEEDQAGMDVDPQGLRIFMPKEDFEDLLLPVRILRLDGIYPLWNSQAYYGLVELHLPRSGYSIGLLQLRNIIISSPKLAVLHFGLPVNDTVALDLPPVQLSALQDLNLGFIFDPADLEKILSMFAPCPKPLKFTMWLEYPPANPLSFLLPDSTITKFFKDSYVETLCLGGPNVDQILGAEPLPVLLPRLRTLVLHMVDNQVLPHTYANIMDSNYRATPYALQTIYWQKSQLKLEYLRHFLGRCSVEAIVLWGCWVSRNDKNLTPDAVIDELSGLSSIVRHVDHHVDFESPTQVRGGWV